MASDANVCDSRLAKVHVDVHGSYVSPSVPYDTTGMISLGPPVLGSAMLVDLHLLFLVETEDAETYSSVEPQIVEISHVSL